MDKNGTKRHEPSKKSGKIRDARLAAGLTQAQLADVVGITDRNVQRIETGEQHPSVGVALRIASTLGRSVEDLFGE